MLIPHVLPAAAERRHAPDQMRHVHRGLRAQRLPPRYDFAEIDARHSVPSSHQARRAYMQKRGGVSERSGRGEAPGAGAKDAANAAGGGEGGACRGDRWHAMPVDIYVSIRGRQRGFIRYAVCPRAECLPFQRCAQQCRCLLQRSQRRFAALPSLPSHAHAPRPI